MKDIRWKIMQTQNDIRKWKDRNEISPTYFKKAWQEQMDRLQNGKNDIVHALDDKSQCKKHAINKM